MSAARARELRPLLERLEGDFDKGARLGFDPVELPRRHTDPAEREVAGLFAAALAYGRADLFKPQLERVLAEMGPSPARFCEAFARAPRPGAFAGFRYRFNRPEDLAALAAAIGHVRLLHGSLGARFAALLEDEGGALRACEGVPGPSQASEPRAARGATTEHSRRLCEGGATKRCDADRSTRRWEGISSQALRPALARFARELREAPPARALLERRGPRGLAHLLPDPALAGACKRWHLYLRWMVRGPDEVDLGAWPGVPRSALVVPLDTHVARIARHLGLTRREDMSWRTAEEITAALRRLDPDDPVRFDFVLCHLGMSGACPLRRDPARCAVCPLAPCCRAKAPPARSGGQGRA